MLLWAFDHLGAQYAETAAMVWNTASRVSEGSVTGQTAKRGSRRARSGNQSVPAGAFRVQAPEWQLNVRGNDAVLRQFGLSGS